MALLLIAGGGTVGITAFQHPRPVHVSAAVNDLLILDKNQQALQQVDQLLEDAAPADSDTGTASPQS
jgi:hypothetical protein